MLVKKLSKEQLNYNWIAFVIIEDTELPRREPIKH